MKINSFTRGTALVTALMAGAPSLHAALIPVNTPPVNAAVEQYTPHDQRIRDGNAALQARDFVAAQAAFDEALRLVSTSEQAMIGLAAAAHARGEPAIALDWLGKALNVAPDAPSVTAAHGRLLTELGDLNGAATRLQAAVDAHSGAREVRLALADWLALQLRRPGDAIPHYRKLLTRDADDSAALLGLGMALLADNKPADSIATLTRALEADPQSDRARLALGHAYLRADRADDALKTFTALLDAGRDDAATRLGRADALVARGRIDEALEEYAAAARLAPRVANVHVRQGVALERAGRAADAEAAYLAALAVDARNLMALNNLAYLSAERKTRLDDALAWAKQALEIGGERAALLDTLGWVHAARGETDQARTALERALALSPDHAAARRHLATLSTPPVANVPEAAKAQTLTSKPLSESELAKVGAAPAPDEEATDTEAPAAGATATDTAATETPAAAVLSAKNPASGAAASGAAASGAAASGAAASGTAAADAQTTDTQAIAAAASKTLATDAVATETHVLAALEQWRQAWENKDINAYLAMYVTTNSPRSNQSRAEWEADRRSKLDKRGAIHVAVSAPAVVVDGDMATVTFEQTYRSRNYRDRERKILTWRETDGQWRIAAEQSEPM